MNYSVFLNGEGMEGLLFRQYETRATDLDNSYLVWVGAEDDAIPNFFYTLLPEVRLWMDEYVTGGWKLDIDIVYDENLRRAWTEEFESMRVVFEYQEDACLFKLRWS